MGNYVNLKEKAYDLIKNKIINLEFMPGDYDLYPVKCSTQLLTFFL